ncbi:hypothetical protein CMV_019172 [Castanea mollissima]|uniref:Uncharacterized protein n=1 Tax=Castanea mollissima TaxID=60419 RepID=A0A8J4QQA3_9ROSI|nr:hypothetical protein CMV_019172 [Castanea mollissima]
MVCKVLLKMEDWHAFPLKIDDGENAHYVRDVFSVLVIGLKSLLEFKTSKERGAVIKGLDPMSRSSRGRYLKLRRMGTMESVHKTTQHMIIYWRDATNTREVDTAFKPSGALFSSFLGSIVPDMIIYWRLFITRL